VLRAQACAYFKVDISKADVEIHEKTEEEKILMKNL
jgi:hypothetical protein